MSDLKLDNQQFSVLEYIYDNPYISYASLASAFSSCNDIREIVLLLDQNHMISMREAVSLEADTEKTTTYFLEEHSHLVTITAGNAVIEEERKRADELNRRIQPLYDIAEKTSLLAESASMQASLAKEQSDKADKTSFSAKIRANLSLIISAFAAIVTVLANADKIVHNLQIILSYLGML